MTKTIRSVFSLLLAALLLLTGTFVQASAAETTIDNSSLLPKWTPYSEVTVDERGTPDWVDSLVMMGCRIATATPEGTFKAAVKVLDHCAEMGVNGLWLTPFQDNVANSHGYFGLGPNTIDPRLTGVLGYDEEWRKTDYEEGFKIFKEFVDEAHKRNIRIIIDIVSWGLMEGEVTAAHPDWFQTGNGIGGEGSKNFIYDHEEAREWFATEVAKVVEKTGVDGIRYDMEPAKFGYGVATAIREKLLKKGIKIASISEAPNERGETAYDFEQYGIAGLVSGETQNPNNAFVDGYNMANCVKTGELIGSVYSQGMNAGGEYQYYTNMLSSHDFWKYAVNGNKIKIGYQAIYSPFIPLWFIGEEWNNPMVQYHEATGKTGRGNSTILFGTMIDWDTLDEPENKAFYEEVKRMLRIRRTYPEIFNNYSENHREANICDVETIGQDNLYSYARYAGNKGLLIVPNDNAHKKDAEYKIYIPLSDMDLDYYESYTVKNLATGKVVAEGTAMDIRSFKVSVEYGNVDVFEVTANGERNVPVTDVPDDEQSAEIEEEENKDVSSDTEITDDDDDKDDDDTQQVVITKRRKKKKKNNDFPWGWVLGGGATALVLIAGVVIWLILYKKRKQTKNPQQ